MVNAAKQEMLQELAFFGWSGATSARAGLRAGGVAGTDETLACGSSKRSTRIVEVNVEVKAVEVGRGEL